MKTVRVLLVLTFFSTAGCLCAQTDFFPARYQELDSPYLSMTVAPALIVPLAGDGDFYGWGAEGLLSGVLHLGPCLRARGEAGYLYVPVRAETFLSIVPAGLGLEAKAAVSPRLELAAGTAAGYYLGFLSAGPFNSDTLSGSNPYLAVDLGISYYLRPALSVGVSASYRNYLGLVQFGGLGCGLSYHIPAPSGSPLRIEEAEVDELFPVLYRTYGQGGAGQPGPFSDQRAGGERLCPGLYEPAHPLDASRQHRSRREPGDRAQVFIQRPYPGHTGTG